MTRFLITLDQGVDFVLKSIEMMLGGEIFVPKIPSVGIADLARVIGPNCVHQEIGIRPGEKLHEVMIPDDDARLTMEFEDHYVIQPTHAFWGKKDRFAGRGGKTCPDGFRYGSETNPWRLGPDEIAKLVRMVEKDPSIEVMPRPTEPTFIVGA
jgi:UDP-N-acetylglucosamine 4,6-dehydratase